MAFTIIQKNRKSVSIRKICFLQNNLPQIVQVKQNVQKKITVNMTEKKCRNSKVITIDTVL
jgi:hypothetical protein